MKNENTQVIRWQTAWDYLRRFHLHRRLTATKYDIIKKKIARFITNYPIKIYKAIYETEVEYVSS